MKPRAKERTQVLVYGAAALWWVMVAAAIRRHEPWADEAQAWVLARDAPLADLWTRLLHYEGSPGLWQTLLKVLIHLHLPYAAYNFVSASLAFAAIWMLLRYSPFPLTVRLLLPFTYYLAYQYSVVARSYALLAPLLFATAIVYRKAVDRPFLFHALLTLIAGVSVHGVIVSGLIWLMAYLPEWRLWRKLNTSERRNLFIAAALYAAAVLFFVRCAWPAGDVAFAENRGSTTLLKFLWDMGKLTLAEPLTGDWVSSLAVLALCALMLWRGGGWILVVLADIALWIFGTLVYAALWHFGVLFLVWLFALWISTYKAPISRASTVAMLAVIVFQTYWTIKAMRYDWRAPYSGSLAAAQYLKQDPPSPGGLYAIGYPTVALQPYFSSNLYSDFNGHMARAYWDWSRKNPARNAASLFSSRPPDRVLVGYTKAAERNHWAGVFDALGYARVREFPGSTFWRTKIFESQAYDVYSRQPGAAPHAASTLNMGEASSADQILGGLYPIEMNAWRWTEKDFSVVLASPPGPHDQGAILEIRLYVSPGQIHALGPMTLRADLNGHLLSAQTFNTAGAYSYRAAVPAAILADDIVTVNGHLDKAAKGIGTDIRELGVVVSFIGLQEDASPQSR